MAHALSPVPDFTKHTINYKQNTALFASLQGRSIWKETLKRKCLERVKENRHAILQRIRQTEDTNLHFDSLISSEWAQMKREAEGGCPPSAMDTETSGPFGAPSSSSGAIPMDFISGMHFSESAHLNKPYGDVDPSTIQATVGSVEALTGNDYLEIMAFLQEQFYKDLQDEELRMIREIQEFEEREIAETVDTHLGNRVLCPVCKKNFLLQHNGVIFCACGMRIDAKHEGLSLEFLQRQLLHLVTEHAEAGCQWDPQFATRQHFGSSMLYMYCPGCQAFQVVI